MQKDAVMTGSGVGVSVYYILGFSLEQWIVILTLVILVLQIGLLLKKYYHSFKSKKNTKSRRQTDGKSKK